MALLGTLLLAACWRNDGHLAPVHSIGQPSYLTSHHYRVLRGDTLYAIAWRYGMDYRDLARINHIKPPYALKPGQVLYTRMPTQSKPQPAVVAKPIIHHKPKPKKRRHHSIKPHYINAWRWPTQGRVLAAYTRANRGIDIAGRFGQAVTSSAAGQVVYAGHGLRTYGNLIIIKHNKDYLSAYAHNSKLLVKEGQRVHQGQQIARMGKSGGKLVMLHFEIRRKGRPVNPLSLLPRR